MTYDERAALLLVDDEPDLLEITRLWLLRRGQYDIITASSGAHAVDHLRKKRFDAIVSDYQMPEMNGIDLLKRVRAEFPDVPFILFTGKGREAVAIEALNNGADFYLQKSGDPASMYAELHNMVEKAVRNLRSEEALRESQERFVQIADISGEFIWEVDPSGLFTYVSPAIERILGYTPSEVVGVKCFYDLFVPEEREELRRAALDAFERKDQIRGMVNANVAKDGRIVYLETMGVPVVEDGKLIGYRGADTDTTQKKMAHDAILHSQNLLDYVISHARSAIAVHDRQMRYIYVSKRYLEEYRVTEENIIGRHHYDVFPDLPEKWRRVHQRALAGEVVSDEEDPYFRDDGSVDWTRWECRPWYEMDGSIGGIIVYTEVISSTKAQKELRRNQQLMGAAMDISRLVNWEYDAEEDMFTFDDRFFALYGTSSEKEGSTKISSATYANEFLHPDDRHMVEEEIAKAMSSKDDSFEGYVEHRIIRRDGQVRYISVRHRAIHDRNGRVVRTYGANQDITDQKMAELALRRANRSLALMNSLTRHDVVNQTLMLESYAEMLGRTSLDPAQKTMLSKIGKAGRSIQAQMEFAKLYQEVGVKDPFWHDLRATIGKAAAILPSGSLQLSVNVDGYELLADALLEKVVYNLIENVIRHGGKATRLDVRCVESNGQLLLQFADDGDGVADNFKGSIFEAGVGRNTGYGLFLAKEVLGITGLTIAENGVHGQGAIFIIRAPPGHWRTHI